jgi:hypothetical protein
LTTKTPSSLTGPKFNHINLLHFSTGVYNFQIEDSNPVYDSCGIFAFPKDWKFLYGPSKLIDVDRLKSLVNKPTVKIKIWMYEAVLHSAILHHIAENFEELTKNPTSDDLIYFPIKDFYSLLESSNLKVQHEDVIFKFIGKYILFHHTEVITDLLKSIRFNCVSTECLLDGFQNTVLKNNDFFMSTVKKELDFRSKNLHIYLTKIERNRFYPTSSEERIELVEREMRAPERAEEMDILVPQAPPNTQTRSQRTNRSNSTVNTASTRDTEAPLESQSSLNAISIGSSNQSDGSSLRLPFVLGELDTDDSTPPLLLNSPMPNHTSRANPSNLIGAPRAANNQEENKEQNQANQNNHINTNNSTNSNNMPMFFDPRGILANRNIGQHIRVNHPLQQEFIARDEQSRLFHNSFNFDNTYSQQILQFLLKNNIVHVLNQQLLLVRDSNIRFN